jgi:uncharacterized protein YgiM (DUF1202 family)
MKNLFQKTILCVVLVLFGVSNAAAQSASDTKSRYVISNGLNVRASESTDAKVIVTLKKCDELTLLGYQSNYTTVNGKNGRWVQVRAKGKTGYVFDANISLLMGVDCMQKLADKNSVVNTDDIVLEPLTDLYKGKNFTVEKNMTAFRSSASLSSKVISFLANGTQVQYLDYTETAADSDSSTNEQFIKVKYNGRIGYINSDNVAERNIFD